MEKLIDLLNEYDDNNWEVTDYGALFNRMNEGISETEDLQVISKKFGFIKWLVDNDKIDRDKFKEKNGTHGMRKLNKWFNNLGGGFIEGEDYSELESVLMILSIQDNPTQFLCEILK